MTDSDIIPTLMIMAEYDKLLIDNEDLVAAYDKCQEDNKFLRKVIWHLVNNGWGGRVKLPFVEIIC